MKKSRNTKNLKKPHISYKYIIGFCAAFAIFNIFIEKIANKNEGKNNSQIQNIRFNQAQSYKPIGKIEESLKQNVKNNFESLTIEKRKKYFIVNLFPVIHKANQNIIEKRNIFFEIEKKIQNNNLNVLEAAILKKLFNEYKVKNNDLT